MLAKRGKQEETRLRCLAQKIGLDYRLPKIVVDTYVQYSTPEYLIESVFRAEYCTVPVHRFTIRCYGSIGVRFEHYVPGTVGESSWY